MQIYLFGLTFLSLLKIGSSWRHSISITKSLNTGVIKPNFYCIFYLRCFISTANPQTEIKNISDDDRFFLENYIKSAISFYFSYYYFYCCDDKNIEEKRRQMVKEEYIKKLNSCTDINDPIRTTLLDRFESDWSEESIKCHNSCFYDGIDYALIKFILKIEKKLIFDRLIIISIIKSLSYHHDFINIIKSNLIIAKNHLESLEGPDHLWITREVKKYNSQAVKNNGDLTCEELKKRFLTSIPNYDLKMLKQIYFIAEDSKMPILNQLRNLIKALVLEKISCDHNKMVNCLADFFFETRNLIPSSTRLSSLSYSSNFRLVSSDYSGVLYKNLETPISDNILSWHKLVEYRYLFHDVLYLYFPDLRGEADNKDGNQKEKRHCDNIK